MADTFTQKSKLDDSMPAVDAVVINFSGGDQDLSTVHATGLYITTAGTLKVDTVAGSTLTFPVIVGELRLKITKIYQTGSSSVVGLVLI